MAAAYKWLETNKLVLRISDGANIPNDSGNRDGTEFQKWATAGNTTDPADPPLDAAAIQADQRVGAVTQMNADASANSKFIRAVLLVILDEVNVIRGNFAPALAARTPAQLKTAIQNKINSGAAD